MSRAMLARQLNYGRSQLYEILDGRIKRPPEWDRLVEPLIRACLRDKMGEATQELLITEWRHRHEVLVRVHDELTRRGGLATAPSGSTTSPSRELLSHCPELWQQLAQHPFVRAVSQGSLPDDAFSRWMINDHYYNTEYQRFIAGLAVIAPAGAATESIAEAIPGSRTGLDKFRQLATRFVIDLGAEPSLATVGLAAYLQSQVSRGYEPAIAALYAAERVYFDTWSSVRSAADRSTPYWNLIDHFSSEPYRHWISSLGRLVDAAAPSGLHQDTHHVFERVARFELLFFSAVLDGDIW